MSTYTVSHTYFLVDRHGAPADAFFTFELTCTECQGTSATGAFFASHDVNAWKILTVTRVHERASLSSCDVSRHDGSTRRGGRRR